MKNWLTASLDVYYHQNRARACAVVFRPQTAANIVGQHCVTFGPVAKYVPGQFYRRELPCLLNLLSSMDITPELLIIDGFVHLTGGNKGLGGHLFEALEGNIPVIGVAKTYFAAADPYIAIFRGQSRRPLYVSSIGIDLASASALIKSLMVRLALKPLA